MMFHQVIKKPLFTEKNSSSQSLNIYVFEVCRESTKDQIKLVIEKAFQVKVESINTSIYRGKTVKTKLNRKNKVKISLKKKAYVKLKKGNTLPIFERA